MTYEELLDKAEQRAWELFPGGGHENAIRRISFFMGYVECGAAFGVKALEEDR